MSEVNTIMCPRCQQQINRAIYSGDFIHDCHGTETLRNEDILITGDWQDYTGSDLGVHKNVLSAIPPNKLQGTRAGLEGNKEPGRRTSRGFPGYRYRTRRYLQYLPSEIFKTASQKQDIEPESYNKE